MVSGNFTYPEVFLLFQPGSHSELLVLLMSLSKTPALKTMIVTVGLKYEWTEERLQTYLKKL